MKARLVGLVALLGTVAFIVGFPVALAAVPGVPTPSWSEISEGLTQPDDGTIALQLLVVVAVLAYVSFVFAFFIEVVAAVRRTSIPRLPGLGWQRRGAAGLVAAIAVLFAGPIAASSAAPPSTSVAVATNGGHDQQHNGEHHDQAQQQQDDGHREQRVATTSYTTQPGDSLWSIAERHLGSAASDARIVKLVDEIADLNRGRVQADGGALDDSHWIQPGWKLDLPGQPAAGEGGTVTVQPGDSLSDLAARHLGDADRWRQLYEANRDQITDPDLIQPGQQLALPGGDTAANVDRAAPPAKESHTSHRQDPTDEAGHRTPDVVPDRTPATQDRAEQQQQQRDDVDKSTNQPAPAPTDRDSAEQRVDADPAADDAGAAEDAEDQAMPVRTIAGVTALLAAGLLSVLATRRTLQHRRRRAGQTFPLPAESATEVVRELRRVESPEGVELVDKALRGLAVACERDQKPLPVVRVGRLTPTQFELGLAEVAELGEPWVSTDDPSVWILPLDRDVTVDVEDVVAPYPSLVVVGSDDEGCHWFVDLEYVGALGIDGDPGKAREVLAGIAVGLATSAWADDLQVTIVGAYPELEDVLQTGRVRYLPAAGRVLDYLQKRAERDREMLATVGAADLSHARAGGVAPGTWFPEIVLLAGEISDAQRSQLSELIGQMPRVAIAAVTEGAPVGEWALRLTADAEVADLEPVGIQLTPQRVDERTYLGVLESIAAADDDPIGEPDFDEPQLAELVTGAAASAAAGEAAAETAAPNRAEGWGSHTDDSPTDQGQQGGFEAVTVETIPTPRAATEADEPEAPADEAPAEETAEDAAGPDQAAVVTPLVRPPRILLLGPLDIEGAQGPTPASNRRAVLLEAIVYLHLNPGVSRDQYIEDVWHGKDISDNTFWTANNRARGWLGRKAEDEDEWWFPYFDGDHDYRLDDEVTSDWAQWRQLLPDGPASAATENLEQALALVRGRPFAGAPRKRYDWADGIHQEMRIAVTDTAAHLAHRMMMEGRWQAAIQAAVKGLSVAREMEQLHRLRIKAAHAAGNVDGVREAVDRLLIVAEQDWDGELEAETDQLLDELPSAELPQAARGGR